MTLFGMTDHDGMLENDIIFTKDWKKIANTSKIVPNTYEVTNLADGRYIDIVKQFSRMLHFKLRLFQRFDGKYGSIDENGNWNGMISNLVSSEADIAVARLTICCRRTEAADFIWTIDHAFEAFAIKG